MIIKSDLRSLVRNLIDDPQKKLWDDVTLDLLTEATMDELWARLFDYFPFLNSQTDTLTPTSPGFIDLRQTGVGTGQLTNRFHRLQSCVVGSSGANAITYSLADPRDVVLQGGKTIYAPNYRYVFYYPQLWLFPLDTTPSSVELKYSYKPTPAYRAIADANTIGWPDGHESALWWEVAARAISKGAREDPTTFRSFAKDGWDAMLSSIRNPQIGPQVLWTGDSGTSWGST